MVCRVLGLDIGINSIGFALIDIDDELQQGVILSHGVHLFDKAEGEKGESLAEPYRLARGARRTIRRRVGRLTAIRRLFEKYNLDFFPSSLKDNDIVAMNQLSDGINPWQLRKEALEKLLSSRELAQVLYHIAKHRGFRSNKKGEVLTGTEKENDLDETGKMLKYAGSLRSRIEAAQASSVGAFFHQTKVAQGEKVRNSNGDYGNTILRQLQEEEVTLIFKRQRELGSQFASEDLEKAYTDHAFSQRPLQSVADMIGLCSLEKEERRAVKNSRSAELFILWTKIKNCKIINSQGSRDLNEDERQILYHLAHSQKEIKYSHVRKALGLSPEEYFNGIRYSVGTKSKQRKKAAIKSDVVEQNENLTWEETVKAIEDKTIWVSLPGYYRLKQILGDDIDAKQVKTWDAIATILSVEQSIEAIESQLKVQQDLLGLTSEQVDKLSKISDFKGTVGHSIKAIQNLIPYLEFGLRYDEAVLRAYGKTILQQSQKLPPFPETTNPIVNRALAQTRKVINAIIRNPKFGMPDRIHVELAREISKNKKEREKLEAENKENEARNRLQREEIAGKFDGLYVDPMVYRLWMEQDRRCVYSGNLIPQEILTDGTAVHIDHILPRRRSFDNSYFNKVLVLSDENNKKGDHTPWEYFQEKPDEEWDKLILRIAHLPKQKRDRITNQTFNEREAEWKERHLNDTRWITRQVLNHIQSTLALPGAPNEKRVMALNGKITADLRRVWGFARKNRDNPRHHALDAMVIAACTESMVQRVTAFNKYQARIQANNGERVFAPNPWPSFRDDVLSRIYEDPTWIISRLSNRKVTGEINGPNPKRVRIDQNGDKRFVDRITLIDLTKDSVKNLRGQLKKDGSPKIEGSLVDNETRNKWLLEALTTALNANDGDPQKAFKAPFKINTPKGEMPIRKISIWGKRAMSGRILVNRGFVDNGSQVRVDVFKKDKKFFLVPVFVWHFRVKEMPLGYCKQKVPQEKWPLIDDSFTFQFSLFPNDYVRCVKQNGEIVQGYYKTTDIALGQIGIQPHDAKDTNNLPHPGVSSLESFEKFQVDYFGNLTKVLETQRPSVQWRKKSRVANRYGAKTSQAVLTT